ncbi:hypothetical protein [Streptomyces sp. NPDC053048]|uniref:hypothetical protein n=1 Tax=Streptomyces sp. NPDC053048 TaxID=3365694 RepID=UPI0037D1E031
MRARITASTVLLAALAGCTNQATRAEIETRCAQAIADRSDGDKTKPAACEPLRKDDYEALVISVGLRDAGVVGDDGRIDPGGLLGTTETSEAPAGE